MKIRKEARWFCENARAMERLGIDGLAAFRTARSSVRPGGNVACGGS